ncbi:MAG TPA: hypothetical protein VGO57_15600 [Verrucomicrobiae bacterium]|jgi:hypothetical protein
MATQPSDFNESLWRRPLTDAERAALRARPDLVPEAYLTAALAKMPDVPVASNFTTRVLAAIELEEAQPVRPGFFHWNWHAWFPRLAVTTAILVFAGVSWQRYEVHSQRTLLAQSVASVAVARPLPSVAALQDFETIQRMGQAAQPDEKLLALLQ